MKYIYPERESRSLEFKSQIPAFSQLVKTCVAFANDLGGKIILGVEDKTREIVGITDEMRNRIYDEFPNSLWDATQPSLLVEIYEKRFGEFSVLIIDVPSSIKKPVYVKSEGMPQGVYLRAGSNTRKANEDYIQELTRENKRVHFDEEIIHADIEILSSQLLKSIYPRNDMERLVNEKVISRSNVNHQKYYPTVAGTLAFCETPEKYIPEAHILCTRFRGTEGRDIIQTEEIIGCLEVQIENAFQLVKSWMTRDYSLQGTKLVGTSLIPDAALREAIINALIHRKYWLPGAVKMALFEDRLEIFNPGNFPGLIDLNHLGDGTTYLRNPNLARIARRFGIIEKLGTGIKLMFDSCEKAGIKKPTFIEGADSVKVVFSFLPSLETQDEQVALLQLFAMREEVKVSDVEEFLNISRNTATRKLNHLIEANKIIRLGNGPAVRYRLK